MSISDTSLDWEDTIVAPATASGSGARAIIRLSGPAAWSIAFQQLQEPPPIPKRLPATLPVSIKLQRWQRAVAADLYLWRAGHSYTGQPTVEWHVPAAPPLVTTIVEQCVQGGCRLARPGEFTLRSFLAGRLDLAQAEGVLGLIQAESLPQLQAALDQRAGGISKPTKAVRDDLLDLLAEIEAALDFVDEDITFVSASEVQQRLTAAKASISALLDKLTSSARNDTRPRVVLVGSANAGKSSLFNALVGQQKALVSATAGTTRDYVAATCRMGEIEVELVDTAGTVTAIDEWAQPAGDQRHRAAQQAHLLIVCQSYDDQSVADEPAWQSFPQLHVRTKVDLADGATAGELCVSSVDLASGGREPTDSNDRTNVRSLAAENRRTDVRRSPWMQAHLNSVSTVTGAGLDALRLQIANRLASNQRDAEATPMAARCHASLSAAFLALDEAIGLASDPDASPEYLAFALREAITALGEVVGAVYTNDMLDRLFAKFCIGK